jgi:hypothetical protein
MAQTEKKSQTIHATVTGEEYNTLDTLSVKYKITLSCIFREMINMHERKDWDSIARSAKVKLDSKKKLIEHGYQVNEVLQTRVLELEKQLGDLLKELRG